MMSGQYWPEGDEVYHAELTVPALLVHGMHDKFVPVEEDQRMAEVGPLPCPPLRSPGWLLFESNHGGAVPFAALGGCTWGAFRQMCPDAARLA